MEKKELLRLISAKTDYGEIMFGRQA